MNSTGKLVRVLTIMVNDPLYDSYIVWLLASLVAGNVSFAFFCLGPVVFVKLFLLPTSFALTAMLFAPWATVHGKESAYGEGDHHMRKRPEADRLVTAVGRLALCLQELLDDKAFPDKPDDDFAERLIARSQFATAAFLLKLRVGENRGITKEEVMAVVREDFQQAVLKQNPHSGLYNVIISGETGLQPKHGRCSKDASFDDTLSDAGKIELQVISNIHDLTEGSGGEEEYTSEGGDSTVNYPSPTSTVSDDNNGT